MIKNEEYEVKFADSGIRILIPPAAHLFADDNKAKYRPDRINVFYLNYFDFWSQMVISKKENPIVVYAGTDYSASIDNREFNDVASFLQKRLIK